MKHILRPLFLLFFLLLSCSAFADFEQLPPISDATANKLYNPNGNVVAGNPKGNITLVEFFDYNCPHCRSFRPKLQQLIAKNPNLRVVYKEYLLFGDASVPATLAALAATNQDKYLQLHDALLQATKPLQHPEILRIAQTVGLDTQRLDKDMQSATTAKQVQDNEVLADALNIQGAPTFIITNRDMSTNAKQPNYTQYIFVGDDGAQAALQNMIDGLNKNMQSTK